ncbi:hypothetical protein BEH94_11930 [Candidatus Altiarchaeales archaeon WOR_SM1_SCG]|nr:hypothetical protein BEH94_11930 [Candidatus Altiarchaeales archaeon WOR_SM1_SCG]
MDQKILISVSFICLTITQMVTGICDLYVVEGYISYENGEHPDKFPLINLSDATIGEWLQIDDTTGTYLHESGYYSITIYGFGSPVSFSCPDGSDDGDTIKVNVNYVDNGIEYAGCGVGTINRGGIKTELDIILNRNISHTENSTSLEQIESENRTNRNSSQETNTHAEPVLNKSDETTLNISEKNDLGLENEDKTNNKKEMGKDDMVEKQTKKEDVGMAVWQWLLMCIIFLIALVIAFRKWSE